MTEQPSDPDATKRETTVQDTSAAFVLNPKGNPPSLVTDTGEHPVVVIKPEPRARFIAGLALDITIVVCITVLILFSKISASEGLPWIALLAGVKVNQMRKGGGAGGAGAVLSILGITPSL